MQSPILHSSDIRLDVWFYRKVAIPQVALGLILLGTLLWYSNGQLSLTWFLSMWACGLTCMVALYQWRLGLLLLLIWAPFPDFLKRLLLVDPESVTGLQWNTILLIPDMLLFAVLAGIFLSNSWRQFFKAWNWTSFWVIVFLGLCLVQILNPRSSVIVGLAGFKLTAIYIPMYLVGVLLDRRLFVHMLKVTVVVGIIVGCYGIFQSIWGMTSFEQTWISGGYTDYSSNVVLGLGAFRPFSTLASNGDFGLYMVVVALASFAIWGLSRDEFSLFILSQATLLMVAVIIRTIHRGSWVVFIGAMICFVASRLRPVARTLFLWVAALGITGMIMLVQTPFLGSLATHPLVVRTIKLNTYNARTMGFQQFLTNSDYHSLLGNGLGTANFARTKYGDGAKVNPHNQFIEWTYELGLLGGVVAICMFVAFYRDSMRALRKVRGANNIFLYRTGLVLLGFITGVLLFGVAIQGFWYARPMALYFWLLLGLIPRLDHL